jgi:hypothetical protein
MAWLRFNMNLQASNNLLTGKLSVMDGATEKSSYTVTSGLPSFQKKEDQSFRNHGPIPSCLKVGLSGYSVRTTPFDETDVLGIEGNFYYIEPDPVTVDGITRGEFGIHFDANVPGSAGCVAFRIEAEWINFQKFMKEYKSQGFQTIALIVEYNKPIAPTTPKLLGSSFFTVNQPLSGDTKKVGKSITFSGTAKSDVTKIRATIGPGGPFLVGEVAPSGGTWSFSQVLVTPGVNRPLKFIATDNEGDLLQTISSTLTLEK